MSVEVKRVFARFAGCCVLVFFAAAFAPAAIPTDEYGPPPHFDSEGSDGMFCMDDMETEPYSDELEPVPVSHVDGGCSVSELPVST